MIEGTGLWAGWEALAAPGARAGFSVIVLTCALIALRGAGPVLALIRGR